MNNKEMSRISNLQDRSCNSGILIVFPDSRCVPRILDGFGIPIIRERERLILGFRIPGILWESKEYNGNTESAFSLLSFSSFVLQCSNHPSFFPLLSLSTKGETANSACIFIAERVNKHSNFIEMAKEKLLSSRHSLEFALEYRSPIQSTGVRSEYRSTNWSIGVRLEYRSTIGVRSEYRSIFEIIAKEMQTKLFMFYSKTLIDRSSVPSAVTEYCEKY